jgi:hypothetical protein
MINNVRENINRVSVEKSRVISSHRGDIPFLLNQALKFIPEPGYFDGTELTRENHRHLLRSKGRLDSFDIGVTGEIKEDTPPFQPDVIPYLDNYAPGGGVGRKTELLRIESHPSILKIEDDEGEFDYEEWKKTATENQILRRYSEEIFRSNYCGYTAAVFKDEVDEDLYYHLMDCRKHWCSICGSKGGNIHKHRKKAIFKRIDITKYNLRQLALSSRGVSRQFKIKV